MASAIGRVVGALRTTHRNASRALIYTMLAVVAAATSRSAVAVGGSTRGRRTTLLAATAGATPSDVLSFWFGSEWHAGVGMDTAEYLKVQTKRWFMGGDDMDAQAQQFVPLIRAAAKGELDKWTSRDGHVARLILLDQLSRNAFRAVSYTHLTLPTKA